MNRKRVLSVLVILNWAVALCATAQFVPDIPENPVQWRVSASPAELEGGEGRVDLVAHATMVSGWKLYALDPGAVRPGPAPRFLSFGFGDYPAWYTVVDPPMAVYPPQTGYDANFDLNVPYHLDEAVYGWTLVTQGRPTAAIDSIATAITYMVCSDALGLCLPPKTEVHVITVAREATPRMTLQEDGTAQDVRTTTDAPSVDPIDEDTLEASQVRGGPVPIASYPTPERPASLWTFILLSLGAGFLSLLTPCVFPMIPLTVSYFTKGSDTRWSGGRGAMFYGLAIIVFFAMLGLLLSLILGASGAQRLAANPAVNLFIAIVLVALAFSLLGFFELRLPTSLLGAVTARSDVQSGVGIAFMALTLVLVSFSCTAPLIGGLLAVAASGDVLYPLVGMVAYASAFALPFVLLALFPSWLQRLPKQGGWMQLLKSSLGLIELAAALKFFSNADLVLGWNVLSRPLAIAVWIALGLVWSGLLLNVFDLGLFRRSDRVGAWRFLTAVTVLTSSLMLLPALLGASAPWVDGLLPPRRATDVNVLVRTDSSTPETRVDWRVDDLEGALAESQAAGKPVFIDFTGYTCTNCRQMEATVFVEPEVERVLSEHFIPLKLYTDGPIDGSRFQTYQLQLTGTVALPTYAIVMPGETSPMRVRSGMMSTEAFLTFLGF